MTSATTNSTPASPSWKRDYLAYLEERGRRRAGKSLADFARYLAPPEYQFSWHHDLLYSHLDDFAAGRRQRLIVQMPPGHGKSEGVSRNLPAYLLGRNPDARIIACSYTADLASEMNRDVQRVIDGERYAGVFPGTRLPGRNVHTLSGQARRNSDIFDVVGARGYYKCAGVGGGITGRRFDYGIIDDPIKDREAANSPVQREAVWRWFTAVFSTRAARNASILLTLTRWHEEDLAGRLLARAAEGGEPWDLLTLPALATDDRHPQDPRAPGEALWPWFKPLPELERQRALDPTDFAALYQQEPRAEGGTEWPESYFGKGIWFDDWPSDVSCRVIALDPSKGKDAKHGDYSAYVLLARSTGGQLWCEADLARRTAERIVEDGIEHQRLFPADVFAVEANAFQELLATQLAVSSRARGIMLPVVPVINSVNKQVRVRRLGPYLARGNVRFRATPGTRLLVKQLRDFPAGDHDDGPDALEMALRAMIEFVNGKRRKGPQRLRA